MTGQMVAAKQIRSIRKRSTSASLAIVGAGFAILALVLTSPKRFTSGTDAMAGGDPFSRRLSPYPKDIFLNSDVGYHEDPNNWLVFLHCIGMLYMLLGLNTVCDVYFAGALEEMVEAWQIQADVAGATFMAAGGSAPELFTSLIGAILAENDVGFGTIVGSAVFNVLFVIGCCGLVAPGGIHLTWWPLFRDSSFYILGLGMLAFFASDQQVGFVEAIILFTFYIVYCIFMYFNPFFEEKAKGMGRKSKSNVEVAPEEEDAEGGNAGATDACAKAASTAYGRLKEDDEGAEKPAPPGRASMDSRASKGGINRGKSAQINRGLARVPSKASTSNSPAEGQGQLDQPGQPLEKQVSPGSSLPASENADGEEDEDDEAHFYEFPEGAIPQLLWYLKWPITAHLFYCTPEPGPNTFLLTFFISLVWIGGYSFLLVWWIEILTEVLGWPIIIMGFTVLAAGTSIPDLVSSMAVAKKGEGDMAVSSSIGSNIFDILVGLPIPWMIKISLVDQDLDSTVSVESPYITFYVLILLGMVFMTVLSIHFNKWRLDKKLGPNMVALWLLFLAAGIFAEMGPDKYTKHLQWNT